MPITNLQNGAEMILKTSLMFMSAAAAGAAGGAAHVDAQTSVVLFAAAGLAGVIGMLYDRQTSETKAVTDLFITVVLAFVMAAAWGGAIGDVALAWLTGWGMDGHYRTAVAAHLGGGLIVGLFFRFAIQLFHGFLVDAAAAFVKRIFSSKNGKRQ